MSERNYYVLRDDNCRFEAMTKEEVIAAIAEATGETPTHIDDAFITKIKEQNKNTPLKFWIGTQAEYNALEEIDEKCFYIFTDTDELPNIIQAAEDAAEEKATELINAEKAKVGVELFDGDIPYGTELSPQIQIDSKILNYKIVVCNVHGAYPVLCFVNYNENNGTISVVGSGAGAMSGSEMICKISGTVSNNVVTISQNRSTSVNFESAGSVINNVAVKKIVGIM